MYICTYADYVPSPVLSISDDGDDSTDVSDLLQGNSSHSFAEDQVGLIRTQSRLFCKPFTPISVLYSCTHGKCLFMLLLSFV